jgi:hypothetical protein
MAFTSSTSIRNANKTLDSPDHPLTRDADSRDRYNFRGMKRDTENEQLRDMRGHSLRTRRADGDADSDGWSTVKPRKSFGTEGAERFNGRMGVDRHRDDGRFKDREDRDTKDRPHRGFDNFTRDRDADHDQERDTRRNGAGRGRNESWFRTDHDGPPTPRDRNSTGDRFTDRNRGWREKDRDDRVGDRGDNRHDRGDRRWDRDRDRDRDNRQEREPEWMDEPAGERSQAHTQEEFQKWKEQMQGKDKAGSAKPLAEEKVDAGGSFGLEKLKVDTPLAIDTGPDKFFGMWAAQKDENGLDSGIEAKKEGVTKSKTAGKASRFTSFFAPQEDPARRQTESNPPASGAPAEGLGALFQNTTPDSREKAAFAELLQKLKGQPLPGSGTTSPANAQQQPKPPAPDKPQSNPILSPEAFQQYRPERQEESRSATRNSQPALQDLLNQRQGTGSQPAVRPEQMLHELVGQRQNALSQSSVRPDLPQSHSNTEFLMNLMQGAKAAPEPQRTEQLLLRMPPGQKPMDRQIQQQIMEAEIQREAAAQRERSASQRQARPQLPPGFFEDPSTFQRGPPPQHERQPQPTQILQRAPPPGLDQMPPAWAQQSGLQGPPQQPMRHHIAPPPGLGGAGPEMRNRLPPPMQQQMFPPGFLPPGISGFQGADVMGPPRMQPPPGFYAPPPGFLPPGMNGGFQGPEGMAFGGVGPFDGRGPPPPQGAFRRQ